MQSNGTYYKAYSNTSGKLVVGGMSADLNPYYVGAEAHFSYDMNRNGFIDDKHNIRMQDVSLTEGESRQITITRTSREPTTVKLFTNAGSGYLVNNVASSSDFGLSGRQISFANGETTASFKVTATDDNLSESTETLEISATVTSPTTPVHYVKRTSTITIFDNDSNYSVIVYYKLNCTSSTATSSTATSSTTTSSTGTGWYQRLALQQAPVIPVVAANSSSSPAIDSVINTYALNQLTSSFSDAKVELSNFSS